MATFAVNETARREQYVSTGQATYNFNFQVNAASELQVYVNDNLQTDSVAYNATIGSDGTGSITFIDNSGGGGTNYTPSSGDYVTIIGDLPLSRTTTFNTSADITPANLDTEFDNTLFRQQQLKEMMDRSIQLKVTTPRTVTGSGTNGPLQWPYDATPSNNASRVIAYDSAGTALELGPTTVDISTVAGISSDITTVSGIASNVTAVANDATDIGTVASNIGSVTTVASNITQVIAVANDLNEAVSEVETVANDLNEAVSEIDTVANSITNVDTVGTNISNVNTVAGISSNVTTVSGISSNVTTVAGISSDVTSVASISSNVTSVANDATDIGTVASSIANVNTAASNITNIDTVAGVSANVTTVAGISGNVTTVAGISSDVTAVANDATDIGTVATNISNVNAVGGISANVTTVAGIASDVTAVANDATDIGTVAGSITNVNNVGGSIANVNTVAGNLSGVNYFGERYRVSATAPTTSLDVGDLYYDTATDTMKVYGSSGWQNAGSSVNGTSERFKYTISGTPTTVSGADDNANTLAYDAGFIDVYLNGIKMVNGTDVTVTSGTQVVFASALSNGDVVDIVTFGTFSVATLDASNLTSGTVPSARVSGAYTGITQTGTLTFFRSTGIDDNADSTVITLDNSEDMIIGTQNSQTSFLSQSGYNVQIQNGLIFESGSASTNNEIMTYRSNSLVFGTSGSERMRLNSTGLGIGTSSPTSKLHVESSTGSTLLKATGTDTGVTLVLNGNKTSNTAGIGSIQFQNNGDSVGMLRSVRESANDAGALSFWTQATGGSNSERMRVTSAGHTLIGKTSVSYNTVGHEFKTEGRAFHTADGGKTLSLNRLTSNGPIVDFYRFGTEIGNIGTVGSGTFYIAEATYGGIAFSTVGAGDINPCTSTGAARDNAMDLGQPTARFKDLYLGGGAYLGGTGSANKLDDYEEGTWTPVFAGSTTAGSYTYTTQVGTYTKIGRLVTVNCELLNITQSSAGSGNVKITGLPFTASSTNNSWGSVSLDRFTFTGYEYAVANVGTDKNFVYIYKMRQSNTDSLLQVSDRDQDGSDVKFTISYEV